MTGVIELLAGGLINSVGQIIDNLHTSDEEKTDAKIRLVAGFTEFAKQADVAYQKELEVRRDVIVAELNQTDNYTKRARPTMLYAGMLFVGLNYVVAPLFGRMVAVIRAFWELSPAQALALSNMSEPLANLPSEFWAAWGGVAGVYVLARSGEKTGGFDGLWPLIVGGKK